MKNFVTKISLLIKTFLMFFKFLFCTVNYNEFGTQLILENKNIFARLFSEFLMREIFDRKAREVYFIFKYA